MNSKQPASRLPRSLWVFLYQMGKLQKFSFAVLFVTGFVWALNQAFFPYFLKIIINTVSEYQSHRKDVFSVIEYPVFGIIGLWALKDIASRLQGYIMLKTFPRFRANIRERIFNYVRQQSQRFFSENFSGSIANKIGDLPRNSESLMMTIVFNFVTMISGFVMSSFMMWHASHLFTLVLMVWFVLHMSITLLSAKHCNELASEHANAVSSLTGRVMDIFTNILTVRLFSRAEYEKSHFQESQHDEIHKAEKARWSLEKVRILQAIIGFAMVVVMLYLLIYGWIQGWVSLGDFSMIMMLTFSILSMVMMMSYQINTFFRSVATAKAALETLSERVEILDAKDAARLVANQPEVDFDNVTFGYKPSKPIFKNLSVKIPAGQKVGLVGLSGAGKTTFIHLLLRLYEVQQGAVRVDQQDIKTVTQDSLHEHIAVIPQEPSLFHRSLMENIRYGRLEATDDEVMQAAKHAHCHEFIMEADEGYDTMVGERGLKLSGGQRQRIAIARAILKNAPILILDEATSALDSITEKHIQECLEYLMEGKTTLVIAHRLSTLANLDRILVFDQGEVVEDGASDELLKRDGCFSRLWAMQSEGFMPE